MNDELKFEVWGIFESFLDDHKEFTKEHEDNPPSPYKPRYPEIDTTANEEFNVYRAISDLSEKELRFLYALMTECMLIALKYSTENEEE